MDSSEQQSRKIHNAGTLSVVLRLHAIRDIVSTGKQPEQGMTLGRTVTTNTKAILPPGKKTIFASSEAFFAVLYAFPFRAASCRLTITKYAHNGRVLLQKCKALRHARRGDFQREVHEFMETKRLRADHLSVALTELCISLFSDITFFPKW